mgnify:FL=1
MKGDGALNTGKFIKHKRLLLGYTQEELARKIGITKSTLSKWESGFIKNMKRDKLELLAAALEISPLELISTTSAPVVAQGDKEDIISALAGTEVMFDGMEYPITPEKRRYIAKIIKAVLEEE